MQGSTRETGGLKPQSFGKPTDRWIGRPVFWLTGFSVFQRSEAR